MCSNFFGWWNIVDKWHFMHHFNTSFMIWLITFKAGRIVHVNCKLQMKVNCRKKHFGWYANCWPSPKLILHFTLGLQFRFSCNSLVHDPGLWAWSCTSELQLKVNCRKKSGWSANCWSSQPNIFRVIHIQLQFTCTWSGPKYM